MSMNSYIYIYTYYIFICFHYRLYTNVYVTIFICIHVCVHPPSCVSIKLCFLQHVHSNICSHVCLHYSIYEIVCFFYLRTCTNPLTYYSMYISYCSKPYSVSSTSVMILYKFFYSKRRRTYLSTQGAQHTGH